jgi:beta-glucuronidase
LVLNWYENENVAQGLARAIPWILNAAGAERPIIASEFGAGGIPGYRDPHRRARWSEDCQVDMLAECLDVYLNHPALCGALVWQFCDMRVDEAWWGARPRLMNDKGVVDEFRRPKPAFFLVREKFGGPRPVPCASVREDLSGSVSG